jgi:ParB/RepB/Spo0J family partition protein
MNEPTQTTVPLSRLTAVDAINARRLTSDRLDELAASIKAKGLISPLVVRLADAGAARGKERYEVIDGRRRWQALQRLAKAKTIPRDHPVPVIVRFNAADYFQRAPKSVAIAALAEMEAAGISDAHIAGGAAFAKKAALATRAAELARQHGWLPPALRHPEYAADRGAGEDGPADEA